MSSILFASYVSRFLDHWSTTLRTQNAIVMSAIAVGIAGVMIIMFGNKEQADAVRAQGRRQFTNAPVAERAARH